MFVVMTLLQPKGERDYIFGAVKIDNS